MSLDTRYIPINTFQEIFLNKDDGCPLAGGVVKFYRDIARTTPKEVYIISGTPPNYVYVSIGTEVTLSSIGTFQYNNADITVYLFPYDASGVLDLYYATVESAGSILQITREGFPNLSDAQNGEEISYVNYVPNGQFRLHNYLPATDTYEEWQIRAKQTTIAPGNWIFLRDETSTATDYVSFERFPSYVTTPSGSPRFSVRVRTTVPDVGDTIKYLGVVFRDVNKFASDTQAFTFSFTAKTNGGSPDLAIKYVKFYGEGGTPLDTETVTTISLTGSYIIYDVPIIFGNNSGKTIGTLNDDTVAVYISFPVSSIADNSFTNFILTDGDVQISGFPITPDTFFTRDSLAGTLPIPSYTNQFLYLNTQLGPNGLIYDNDDIGSYVPKSTNHLGIRELWADGSKYKVDDYSDVGIPYKRLYERLSGESHVGLAMYGTGADEFQVEESLTRDQVFTTGGYLYLNGPAPYQSFTAGNNNTLVAVTYFNFFGDTSLTYTLKIYSGEGTGGTLLSTNTGIPWRYRGWVTVYLTTPFTQTSGQKYSMAFEGIPYDPLRSDYSFQGTDKGGYSGGHFFDGKDVNGDISFGTLTTPTATPTFRLSANTPGAVTPAGDGAVPTGFTFTPVQPNPYIVDITAVAASGMTAGSYWIYHTTDARKVIVYEEIDGVGTQPTETADVYRKAVLTSSDSAILVANKNAIAVNSYSIRIPGWGGLFMRVTDKGAGRDPGALTRTDRGDGTTGDEVGTEQLLPDTYDGTSGTSPSPKNKYANWAMKY